MKIIPLSDLDGEIMKVTHRGGFRTSAVRFVCPVCLEANGGDMAGVHSHMVFFIYCQRASSRYKNIAHIWGHAGGSGVDDITLQPSYLAETGDCRVHCFIRGGAVQLLGDSRPLSKP